MDPLADIVTNYLDQESHSFQGSHKVALNLHAQKEIVSDKDLSLALSSLTSAFGDPTRRQIYLFTRSVGQVTAGEVAEHFDLHPNVARHHLEKLASGGYIKISIDKTSSSAGRPSKKYGLSNKKIGVDVAPQFGDVLVTLLAKAFSVLDPKTAEVIAEQVGEEYGRNMVSHMELCDIEDGKKSLRSALALVADALSEYGFAAHVGYKGSSLAIISEKCPFGTTASQNPVICAVDRGMIKGMLKQMHSGSVLALTSSKAQGDNECIAFLSTQD